MSLSYSSCLALSLAILCSVETLVLLSPVLILHKIVFFGTFSCFCPLFIKELFWNVAVA